MNILITGGAGFIGSNTVEYFKEKAEQIIIIDNLSTGFKKNIDLFEQDENITFYHGDIRDSLLLEKVFSSHAIDICINYAALISVAESVEKPVLTEDINVNGIINLLEVAGKNNITTFVHASSAAVYGDNPELPKIETMTPEPKSPYAVTKLAGEYYNNYFSMQYGFTAINCRFFNVFGKRQNPRSAYAAAIPIFIEKAIQHEPLTIFGDGEQTRDFIYVEDLVSAIDFFIEHSETIQPFQNVFNLGYGEYITINTLAQDIIATTKSTSQILHADARPGDIKHSYAAINNLLNLGWKPAFGFKKGLDKTIQWFINV